MKALPSLRHSLRLTPHQFNLSNHQLTLIDSRTKKLMKTIIRLAKLMRAADPLGPVSLKLNSWKELEVLIGNFLYLVNKDHFPLSFYREEEWRHEEVDEWIGGSIPSDYHPTLDQIPVNPLGFSDHDIEPEDYGDLVALLYWLGEAGLDLPKFDTNFDVNSVWSMDERANFNLTQTTEILETMEIAPPINHLSGLIRSVLHQTDTFFLDACPLCGGFSGPDFDWTVENFIWYRDDWRRAKPIYDGNQELIEWSRNSSMRLTEISTIMKLAQRSFQ